MIKKFSPNHQYKAENGSKVLIYNWDCGGKFPIHGAVEGRYKGMKWSPTKWGDDGRNPYHGFNLVKVRKNKKD